MVSFLATTIQINFLILGILLLYLCVSQKSSSFFIAGEFLQGSISYYD